MELREKQEEFLKELKLLTDKYEIKHVCFAGVTEDCMWGFIGLTPLQSLNELSECVSISARLYQSAREKIFKVFDKMAK